MIKERIPELNQFTKQDKLDLAKELWDEVHDEVDFSLTEEQKSELDRRLREYRENPDNTIALENVKRKLKANIRE